MGDVIVVTNSPPIGHMRSQLTNHQVGIVLYVQAWSENYIKCPDVVERLGSYLGTSFPLFHGSVCVGAAADMMWPPLWPGSS